MRSGRADNRWDHPAIIQDVVALIDQAAIVICDCSGKNANVFYEMGIAHALGKEVIIITQNPTDIPFDIAHLRHIRYLGNDQGIEQLEADLTVRIRALRER
jgi:nucleoside 2-deoxyribosyltransferase